MAENISELAAALRRLRLEQGGPTYEALARAAGLSRSTVAEAFAGGRLPSERTLYAIVDALGEDPASWLADREAIAGPVGVESPEEAEAEAEAGAEGAGGEGAGGGASSQVEVPEVAAVALVPTEPAPPAPLTPRGLGSADLGSRRVELRWLVPLLVVALAVGALATRLWWPREIEVSAGPGRGTVEPATGENIFDTGCVDDGEAIASQSRDFETQFEVRISYLCNAVWARVYRYDGSEHGNKIKVQIYPKTESDPGELQEAIAEDTQVAITTMIVQEDVADQFCAEAWVTDGSQEWVSLGLPICV